MSYTRKKLYAQLVELKGKSIKAQLEWASKFSTFNGFLKFENFWLHHFEKFSHFKKFFAIKVIKIIESYSNINDKL
jgi:hypothetical protein